MSTGKLIVSLDFELIYGMLERGYEENVMGGRVAIPQLLALFEKHGIHATWATVGCMFAESMDDMKTYFPDEKFYPTYNAEVSPYETLKSISGVEAENPCFLGASLIKQVAETEGQEIGTHTFAHYYCQDPGQNIEQFKADMESAVKIAKDKGYDIKSIVFPKNEVSDEYIKDLPKYGITSYRDVESTWQKKIPENLFKRLLRLLDVYVNTTGQNCFMPEKKDGLVSIIGSRMYKPYFGPLALLEGLKVHRIKRSMRYAAKNDLMFHLWWHPHNVGVKTDFHLKQLEKIFSYYDVLKEKYGMESLNMKEVAETCKN